MDELLPFNNKIDTICVISDNTVVSSTVVPAGRHRNNYILAIMRIINTIRGVSFKVMNDKAQWSMRTSDMIELMSALNIVPDQYINDQIQQSMDILRENLSRPQTKSEGSGNFEPQLLNIMIEGIFTLITELRDDMPKVLITGLLYGAGVGNMISIQPKLKVKGCGTCILPEYKNLIDTILNSKAKTLFDIEHSMTSRIDATNPSYSTSDAIMTSRSKFMPLENVYRNAKDIESVMNDYDPVKLIISPMQWGITNSDDTLNDIAILFQSGLPVNKKPEEKPVEKQQQFSRQNLCFAEACDINAKLSPVEGTSNTIYTFKHDVVERIVKNAKNKERFTRKELREHFEFLITSSNLEETVRTYLIKHVSRYSQYGMNNKVLLNDKILEELLIIMEDQDKNISDRDMRLCFGDDLVQQMLIKNQKQFTGMDINLDDDEDYNNDFSKMKNEIMMSEAVIEDKTQENIADYIFLTTINKRTTFNMTFVLFTKVLEIYDETSTQLIKRKVQPGAQYSFYCKYLGIEKKILEGDNAAATLMSLTAQVRYKDLIWCDNKPFIELFNQYDVDIDSAKLAEWNKLSVGHTITPIVRIDNLPDLKDKMDLINCIKVNMWMNEILSPLQKYVGQIDDVIRDQNVLLAYKMKAPKLHKIIHVAGASAFVSGAHIPRNSKDDMYYYLLTQLVLIPTILRHGVLGIEEAGTPSNVLKTMNNYIQSIQES